MTNANLREQSSRHTGPRATALDLGATTRLAENACAFDLATVPDPVLRIARLALLDWYAVTWAGKDEQPVRVVRTLAEREGGVPEASLIGAPGRLPASAAALVNGAAGHVLDYDDVQNEVPGHATAPVAPAVLALAEAIGASGREALTAFVVAFETTCRMGRLLSPGHFKRGWQSSTVTGTIGAAVGCGRLLGLDRAQMTAAIGLAAAQAGGLQAAFGSDSKCINVGQAARAGLVASLMAQGGLRSAPDILEAPRGFASVYADGADIDHAFAEPEGGWHLCRNLFKHHAACFMTHSPLEALVQIGKARALSAESVGAVRIRIEGDYHRVVLTPPPRTGLEAKFNLAFCCALLLAGYDTGDPAVFSDALAGRSDLHALAERCQVEIDPLIQFTAATVEVTYRDGAHRSVYVDVGEPEADVDRLEARVRDKAALLLSGLAPDVRDRLIGTFLEIDSIDDITRLYPAAAA